MINEDIIRIKDSILKTVGDDCEKIILFGSYAYGTPREDSDYDFYVVLKDGAEHPILVMQKIYEYMWDIAMFYDTNPKQTETYHSRKNDKE
jgi:predicted nucleotidyltransferase